MNKYFALIKNNIVESVAVGDDLFREHIADKYDYIIDVTDRERPNPEDSYYRDTDAFISNTKEIHNIEVDLNANHLNEGTETTFEPFNISKYSVKYEDGLVCIGCKKYSGPGILDALHKILIEKQKGVVSCFVTDPGGPLHGKFRITWEDAKKMYEILKKVKFQ